MDILVISDSHGHADRIQDLIETRVLKTDAIFFLGDGLRDIAWLDTNIPIYKVKGNCDFYCEETESEILTELGGKLIFASHGHKYSVKSTEDIMIARAASLGADIMLYGHTHLATERTVSAGETVCGVTLKKKLHILNPGSIGSSDRGYGVVVIHGGNIITSLAKI